MYIVPYGLKVPIKNKKMSVRKVNAECRMQNAEMGRRYVALVYLQLITEN